MATKTYRIHPGVGIARIGDSPTKWFIGPEVPGEDFQPEGGAYRDGHGKIRRQAQRFRIYEYEDGVVTREITLAEADTITWEVHVVNRKSYEPNTRARLPIDPGSKEVSGADQSCTVAGRIWDQRVMLGDLKTDASGRLLVLGGRGVTGHKDPSNRPPVDGIRNPDWFDDVCDGPVRATIKLGDQTISAESAWVVTGVPAFAAPVLNLVTPWDLAEDAALGGEPEGEVDFYAHIYPVLRRTVLMQWASAGARTGHGGQSFLEPRRLSQLSNPDDSSKPAREAVCSRLRGLGGNMPVLGGGLQLTTLQRRRFKRWAEGRFKTGVPASRQPLDRLPISEQPSALDRASLDSMCGGSFVPGIEVGRRVAESATWDNLRIKAGTSPGALTEQLGVPWQADFRICVGTWWPGSRPGVVSGQSRETHAWVPLGWRNEDMVDAWHKLGFLIKTADTTILERERLQESTAQTEEDADRLAELQAIKQRLVAELQSE